MEITFKTALPRTLAMLCVVLSTATQSMAQGSAQKGTNFFNYIAIPTKNNYNVGEQAQLRVFATAGGNNLDGVEATFEAGVAGLPKDTAGTAVFHNGEAIIPFGTMNKPGFRFCKIKFEAESREKNNYTKSYSNEVTVGFDPQNIKPTVNEPADFNAFWKNVLKKAAKVPMKVEYEEDAQHSNDKVLCRKVKIQSFEKGFYIYGYLSQPRDDQKHPVMLVVPGAGVKPVSPSQSTTKLGFITLSIGINGVPLDLPDSSFNKRKKEIGDYWLTGIESRDTYYYKRVYASLVRCIDMLVQHPQFDGKNVAVTGGSQGGALTMIAAGLDRRVTAAAAFYPALCDIGGFERGTVGGWPNIAKPEKTNPVTCPAEQWLKTVSYYDVAVFAKHITAPGFYSFGYNDRTCSPTSTCGAINNVTAPKVVVVTPSSTHGRFDETQNKMLNWMLKQMK